MAPPAPPSLTLALTLASLAVAAGSAVGALESLRARAAYACGGVFDWEIIRLRLRATARGPVSVATDRLFRYPAVLGLFAAQLAAAAALVAVAGHPLRWPPIAVLLATHLAATVRHRFGLDGSDQMIVLVLVGLLVITLAPDRSVENVALAFVTAQLLLSYVVAGVAKAVSPEWRSGRAVSGVMETRSYGSSHALQLLRRRPGLATALAWATIGFEISAPVLLLAGPWPAVAFVVAGIAFHVAVAVMMGLNSFVPAFLAAYPLALVAAGRSGVGWW